MTTDQLRDTLAAAAPEPPAAMLTGAASDAGLHRAAGMAAGRRSADARRRKRRTLLIAAAMPAAAAVAVFAFAGNSGRGEPVVQLADGPPAAAPAEAGAGGSLQPAPGTQFLTGDASSAVVLIAAKTTPAPVSAAGPLLYTKYAHTDLHSTIGYDGKETTRTDHDTYESWYGEGCAQLGVSHIGSHPPLTYNNTGGCSGEAPGNGAVLDDAATAQTYPTTSAEWIALYDGETAAVPKLLGMTDALKLTYLTPAQRSAALEAVSQLLPGDATSKGAVKVGGLTGLKIEFTYEGLRYEQVFSTTAPGLLLDRRTVADPVTAAKFDSRFTGKPVGTVYTEDRLVEASQVSSTPTLP